jgi:PTS system galactitol-specific IIA component
MALLKFTQDHIVMDMEADNAKQVIDALAGKLVQQGCVAEDYGCQTYEREVEHPTGLPTQPFCIAFPHADATGVHESALAFASLRKPVVFKNMADPDEDLDVLLVFMLANKNPEEQIQTLRNLSLLFGQPEKLQDLREQSTLQAVAAWLERELRLS